MCSWCRITKIDRPNFDSENYFNFFFTFLVGTCVYYVIFHGSRDHSSHSPLPPFFLGGGGWNRRKKWPMSFDFHWLRRKNVRNINKNLQVRIYFLPVCARTWFFFNLIYTLLDVFALKPLWNFFVTLRRKSLEYNYTVATRLYFFFFFDLRIDLFIHFILSPATLTFLLRSKTLPV